MQSKADPLALLRNGYVRGDEALKDVVEAETLFLAGDLTIASKA